MFDRNYNITWLDNKGCFSPSDNLDLILSLFIFPNSQTINPKFDIRNLQSSTTVSSSIQSSHTLYIADILNRVYSILIQRRWRMKTKWLSAGQSKLGPGCKKVELNPKRDELKPCIQVVSCVIIVAPLPKAAASEKTLLRVRR